MRSFAQLFQGRTDCFGVYTVFERRKDGKQKGKGTTYPNDTFPDRVLAQDDWDKHLSGTQMLGIVPVLPDGTCSWFAIDIDDYGVSHKKLVVDVEKLELPLVTCRSKSGGAHLYCFINGFIDAQLAIELGHKWAKALGFEGTEVFPKQAKPDKGNWIIIPYYGGDKAVDFAISLEGDKLDIDEFVQWANAKQIQPGEAPAYLKRKEQEPSQMTPEDILAQSPPCILHFMDNGVSEGGRNNVLCHLASYYLKLDEFFGTEVWRDKLMEFNQKYLETPVTFGEINHIIRSYGKKNYQYKCKDTPMCNVCDKDTCIRRTFGVGEDKSYYGDLEIMSMIKIDSKPPVWIPRINGVDVEMDTETLLAPRKFRMAIADALNVLVPSKKQSDHDDMIGPIMKTALTIEPMDELTVEGKVMNSFTEWTKNMVTKSRDIGDLEKGLPYYNQEEETIYFRGSDFTKEYRRIYKDNVTERGIWTALRKNNFQRKQIRLGKSPEWIWFYNLAGEERWFDTDMGEVF